MLFHAAIGNAMPKVRTPVPLLVPGTFSYTIYIFAAKIPETLGRNATRSKTPITCVKGIRLN